VNGYSDVLFECVLVARFPHKPVMDRAIESYTWGHVPPSLLTPISLLSGGGRLSSECAHAVSLPNHCVGLNLWQPDISTFWFSADDLGGHAQFANT
jgi:hypothetical protein